MEHFSLKALSLSRLTIMSDCERKPLISGHLKFGYLKKGRAEHGDRVNQLFASEILP
jgi:hypothetical protein